MFPGPGSDEVKTMKTGAIEPTSQHQQFNSADVKFAMDLPIHKHLDDICQALRERQIVPSDLVPALFMYKLALARVRSCQPCRPHAVGAW